MKKLIIFILFLSTAHATDIKIDNKNGWKVFYENKNINIDEIEKESENYNLYPIDINNDGTSEILMRYESLAGINSTDRIFFYNKRSNKFIELKTKYFLSNLSKQNHYLISRYRDAANFYEEVLKYDEASESLVSLYKDKEYDESLYLRKNSSNNEEYLVSGNANVLDRKKITTSYPYCNSKNIAQRAIETKSCIKQLKNKHPTLEVIKKSHLYTAPNKKTKMYLIKGDKVTVLDEQTDDKGQKWYFINYKGKKDLNMWIKAEAIDAEVSHTIAD